MTFYFNGWGEHIKERANIAFDSFPDGPIKMEDSELKWEREKVKEGTDVGQIGEPPQHVWDSGRKEHSRTQYEVKNALRALDEGRDPAGRRERNEGDGKTK